mgnify:CR=1 FL=1
MKRFKPLLIILTVLAVVAGACATVAVMGAANTPPVKVVVTPTPTPTPQPATKEELLRLVNEERAKVGVAPLVLDAKLEQSAQWKADDMVTYNYFDHVSPNDGKHGYEYINDVGIYCRTDGENITTDTGAGITASATVSRWVDSKPHYAAMINPDNTLTGFGISIRSNGQLIAVEHFCEQ